MKTVFIVIDDNQDQTKKSLHATHKEIYLRGLADMKDEQDKARQAERKAKAQNA